MISASSKNLNRTSLNSNPAKEQVDKTIFCLSECSKGKGVICSHFVHFILIYFIRNRIKAFRKFFIFLAMYFEGRNQIECDVRALYFKWSESFETNILIKLKRNYVFVFVFSFFLSFRVFAFHF